MPEGELDDGDLQQGGELFRTNCASCHNFAGNGGALTYGKYAPDLSDASARVIYGRDAERARRTCRASPTTSSRRREEGHHPVRRVHHQDTAARRRGLGRYGPVPEGLVMWLVGITALVGVTLWIGARA